MATVLFNRPLGEDFYLLKAALSDTPQMGQFYMLRGWEHYPVLSRPISVYDADEEGVTFLYRVVGEGTRLLSALREGDEITCNGPYGNGYPIKSGRIALVGGGVGVAPLYLTAKTLRQHSPDCKLDIYLGFRGQAILRADFEAVCDRLTVNIDGFVTDDITPSDYDVIFTCGPEAMMKALYQKAKGSVSELYVSLENRMACGLGACLVCTCKTKSGNKKACKDGPVLLGEEVFGV